MHLETRSAEIESPAFWEMKRKHVEKSAQGLSAQQGYLFQWLSVCVSDPNVMSSNPRTCNELETCASHIHDKNDV